MISTLWAHVKGLAIIGWAVKALKQLWPFLLAIIFWPEIDALLSGLLPFWDEYVRFFSDYVLELSGYIRAIPYLGDAFEWLDKAFAALKDRLVQILQGNIAGKAA